MMNIDEIASVYQKAEVLDDYLFSCVFDSSKEEFLKKGYESPSHLLDDDKFFLAKKIWMIALEKMAAAYDLIKNEDALSLTAIKKEWLDDEVMCDVMYDVMYDMEGNMQYLFQEIVQNSSWDLCIVDMSWLMHDIRQQDGMEFLHDLEYPDDFYDMPDDFTHKIERTCIQVLRDYCGFSDSPALKKYMEYILEPAMENAVCVTHLVVLKHPVLSVFMCNYEKFKDILPDKICKLYENLLQGIQGLFLCQYSWDDCKKGMMECETEYSSIWELGYTFDQTDNVSWLHMASNGLMAYLLMDQFLQCMQKDYPILFEKSEVNTDGTAKEIA